MTMDNKMKKFLLCVLVVCGLAACEKKEVTDDLLSVEAGLPSSATRTALGNKTGDAWPLLWSAGDCLMLNGVQSTVLSASEAGGPSATFRFAGVGGASVWNYTYCGVAGSDCTVVFPAAQSSGDGNIAPQTLPMYAATSSVSGITLSPLGAVLRFSFTSASAVTLDRIQITAIGGEPVCGNYTIGKNGAGLLNGAISASGNNRDNVVVSASTALSSSGKPFCAVVPAGTYQSGFKALVTASGGRTMEVWFNTKSDKTLSAGTLYDFGTAEFVATGSVEMSVMDTESFTVDTVSY